MASIDPSFYFERLYPLQDAVLMQLSLPSAITSADSKAAGIFPVEVARILDSASQDDWAAIKWISAPDPMQFVSNLRALAESLILNP